MTVRLNQSIGERYLVRAPLREGAHGCVYRVWDAVRRGEVALKLFKEDAMDAQTAEAARHFEVAEGSAILPLLEVHPEFAEGQVTVMPLMTGGTLADALPVFASRAIYVTRRILTALEFCHGRGVVHGDVKPSNAFVDRRNAVLLGDFGVAGYTLEYAAPELLDGAEKTAATDLWATAVTFYELLCADMPFGARPALDEEEVASRIQSVNYIDPDERLPFLPMRFRRFFRNCFIADPAERPYQLAASMRAALRDLTVRVEWVRFRQQGAVFCFEGHEVSPDGHRSGVTYRASVVERPRKGDFLAEIKRASHNGSLRRLHRLTPFAGSKRQAGEKLSVWMRTLTAEGDLTRG